MDIKLIYSIYALCIGGCIGSFFNLIACRLPKEESIVKPGSHCTKCNHKLKMYENIPIISYIILGGRCSSCKTSIGAMDFILEIIYALYYFLIFYFEEDILRATVYCIAFSVLMLISYIDYITQEVYVSMPVITTIVILALRLFIAYKSNSYSEIIGTIIAMGILTIIFYLLSSVIYKGKLGDGDVYIFNIVASALTWDILPNAILTACLSGIIYILVLRLFKNFKMDNPIAFGPHICIGFLLISLYISIF